MNVSKQQNEDISKKGSELCHQVKKAYGMMYYVSDLERAIDFYSHLLCMKPSSRLPRWAEFDGTDYKLCLQESSELTGRYFLYHLQSS